MNEIFYKFIKLKSVLPFEYLMKIAGQNLVLPFYHSVSNVEVAHIKHLYRVRTSKEFDRDLDFLLKHYKPVDYSFLKESIYNNKVWKEKCFLLSFDDGLREFYDVIAPILIRKGVPAICFLNSAFIDNKDIFYRYKASILVERLNTLPLTSNILEKLRNTMLSQNLPIDAISNTILSIRYSNKQLLDELAIALEVDFRDYLLKNKPYLSFEQIVSLQNQGFVFGAHSVDHPQFSEIEETQQLMQVQTSIEAITQQFKLNDKIFSFPFTDADVSRNFFECIFDEKSPVADLTFGCAGLKKDSCVKNIQRIPLEIANYTAQEILYGEYLYFILKKVLNKNTIKRL